MKIIRYLLIAVGLLAAGMAQSQTFQSLGSASLAVTSSTGNVALPAGNFGNNITIQNVGSNEAFISFGASGVTAATTGESVPAGAARCFTAPNATYVAAITGSSTTTLRISQGNGPCSISFRGGAGSGGTVTSVSVVTANGISGTVATATTTPAITLVLGAITPTSAAIGAGTAITSSGPGGALTALAYTAPGTGVVTALGNTAGAAGGFALFGSTAPTGAAGGSLSGTYPNPALAAVNSVATSFAIGGATIGTDALAWTGTATGSGQLNAASFVPTGSTIPTNGMYLSGANTLGFATNTSLRWTLSTNFQTNISASGPALIGAGASSTVPVLIPNRADTTTGIGAQAAGNVSMIVGAVEQARYSTGAASVATVLWPGTLFTGGTATTNFPQLFVQPTGTTAATSWSTSGTIFGANVVSGFAGNFLDFHVAGGASLFNVSASGTVVSGTITTNGNIVGNIAGSSLLAGSTGSLAIQRGAGTSFTSPAAGTWQLGVADAAAPVAQTLRAQSVVAGTAATSGANWTLIGSLPTGTGTSGDIIIQTGVKTGSGTTQGTATTALTIKGETQVVNFAAGANFGQQTLSNYTATTWTPAITTDGTAGTPVYSAQVGSYEQIGRQVTARFNIVLSSWGGSPTGSAYISLAGLPAPTATANDIGGCYFTFYTVTGLPASTFGITAQINPSASTALMLANSSTTGSAISAAQVGSTPTLRGVCNYHT